MICTRCEGTGYLNTHQLNETMEKALNVLGPELFLEKYKGFVKSNKNDVQVCDCCGDSALWYGIPGEHYNIEDPKGRKGVYGYNGGFSECH